MSTFLRGVCATLLVWCLPGALLSAQDKGKTPDDDPELRLVRAEIGLLAERINRAGSLLEAEMQGKEVRTDLEKAREKLVVMRYSLGDAKTDVATKTREIRLAAEAVENRNKKRD